MKTVTIVGARPQFIKAAAVSRAIARYNQTCLDSQRICEIIVHTGQHYDANMSQIFFDELQIPIPDHHLEVGSGIHGEQTGLMLQRIEQVLLAEQPDAVMVYGDTNSTLAGALAACKLHIPALHVEAGLRSYNRRMPEEINRIVADQTCNVLLCPTEMAVANLRMEGVVSSSAPLGRMDFNDRQVCQVGDVMYDSVLFNSQLSEIRSRILEDLGLAGQNYALATIHRAENTDEPERLAEIVKAFQSISTALLPLVLPLHPRTRKCLAATGMDLEGPGMLVIDPVGYLDMIRLEKQSRAILTDSGGVQKEAYFMGVPCITMRDETEWVETVALGWNCLVGADASKIVAACQRCLATPGGLPPFNRSEQAEAIVAQPYGDGRAAEQIVAILAGLAENSAAAGGWGR
jgi:UDP-N-acetylglucosamine 2-epimerase (non-hydrolysing)/UDP-GlcNAc3NAcA epimerase